MSNKIIAVDFDGTIVAHAYPAIGRANPHALPVLRRITEAGHKLILWTMRDGDRLIEAVDYCNSQGITFWGVNTNPDQVAWTSSPKAYAPIYIDDAALGCPLIFDKGTNRNMVNWHAIETMLTRLGILS